MTNIGAWDYAIGVTRMAGLEPTFEFKRYNNHGGRQMLLRSKIQKSLKKLCRHAIVEVGIRKETVCSEW